MPDPIRSCEKMLRNSGCSEKVIAHCRAVTECAREYASHNPDINFDLVLSGSMLHDIGRSRTHTIHHAQEGADLLRQLGCPEELARVVECHTGAGLTADECTLLGLSPRNCIPETTEEKIVAHADNLIAGRHRTSIDQSIGSAIHLPKKARKRMYRLSCEVELLCRE
nr:HDIG domain-containing metalloprotein [uncultured Methanoregula sp.]